VKLIEFALAQKPRRGLAKLFGGRKKVQGTRSYMSPEQIRGEALDPRADIYSFGCMLFELFSGKLPYAAPSPNELLNKHLRAAVPSVSGVNNNVTADCAELISSMMAKKREQRPDTMNEFVKTFQQMKVFRTAPKPATGDSQRGAGGG
jgi:serine/threonine protein kinase